MRRLVAGMAMLCLGGIAMWLMLAATRTRELAARAPLPAITFVGSTGSRTLHPDGRATIVAYFRSTCTHCNAEFQDVQRHLERLRGARLVLLTPERTFFGQRLWRGWPALARSPQVEWGVLDAGTFRREFGASVVPALFVFDRGGRLVRSYRGETGVEAIARALAGDARAPVSSSGVCSESSVSGSERCLP